MGSSNAAVSEGQFVPSCRFQLKQQILGSIFVELCLKNVDVLNVVQHHGLLLFAAIFNNVQRYVDGP